MVLRTDEEEGRIPEGKPFRGPLKGPRCVVTGACECRMAVTVPRALPKYHLKRMYKFQRTVSCKSKRTNHAPKHRDDAEEVTPCTPWAGTWKTSEEKRPLKPCHLETGH